MRFRSVLGNNEWTDLLDDVARQGANKELAELHELTDVVVVLLTRNIARDVVPDGHEDFLRTTTWPVHSTEPVSPRLGFYRNRHRAKDLEVIVDARTIRSSGVVFIALDQRIGEELRSIPQMPEDHHTEGLQVSPRRYPQLPISVVDRSKAVTTATIVFGEFRLQFLGGKILVNLAEILEEDAVGILVTPVVVDVEGLITHVNHSAVQ